MPPDNTGPFGTVAILARDLSRLLDAPDTDLLELSAYLARDFRRELRAAEERIADALPPLTEADFRRMANGDHAIRQEVEGWRDRRWSVVDVSDLPAEHEGEGWTILRGSSRFEVREVPRYEARRAGGAGNVEGWIVWDNETNEQADWLPAEDYTESDAPLTEEQARDSVARMNAPRNTYDETPDHHNIIGEEREMCWIVWDTDDDTDARDGDRYGPFSESGRDDYDPADEDSARDAAEQANVEDYRENAAGWPFAHNYAAQIDEREAEDFAAAGFVVARHEPSGQVYAGVDAGGFDFVQAFWCPLYLRVLLPAVRGVGVFRTEGPTHIYVPTAGGLRRVVKA